MFLVKLNLSRSVTPVKQIVPVLLALHEELDVLVNPLVHSDIVVVPKFSSIVDVNYKYLIS